MRAGLACWDSLEGECAVNKKQTLLKNENGCQWNGVGALTFCFGVDHFNILCYYFDILLI